ncbi:hypothetical protein C467_02531 [Halorubrum hochstenium ATCC 700873]|uniref:Uncharacterized protein n=1 Tax=Halorubrum hochstenium ATCC 700873 TaxID=1227481 RepID=M0FJ87_9EURY|nr:hypothetical protein C467_02531 [Halorubrum hochstenium ATCC 700873]
MDRTEFFLALIVFLLAAQIFQSEGQTAGFIMVPVLLILVLLPFYVVMAAAIEHDDT